MPFLYSSRLFQRAEQFGTNVDLVGGKDCYAYNSISISARRCKMANSVIGFSSYLRPQ